MRYLRTDSGEEFPTCREACEFRDDIQAFDKKGAVVVGISPDKPAAQAKFKTRYSLPFPLLADEDKAAANAYGVWKEKNMYGKKVMGIERTTFVIGPDGKIEKIYGKVKAKGHAAEVLGRFVGPDGSLVASIRRGTWFHYVAERPRHSQDRRRQR